MMMADEQAAVAQAAESVPAVSGPIFVEIFLLALLFATAISMIRMRQLFSVAMLSGIYSLLSAAFFVALDAVDVAFTEAAVGAGISTVLILTGVALTRSGRCRSTASGRSCPSLSSS